MSFLNHIIGGTLEFANPWGLLLLVLVPAGYYLLARFRSPTMIYTVTSRFKGTWKRSFRVKLWKLIPHLWAGAIFFFSLAAARPRAGNEVQKIYTRGIDIVITLDISSSMLAMDFKPNRVEAAKKEAAKFIEGRPNDRIGLVVFAARAFPQCPLTIDHSVVLRLLDQVQVGMIEDGTAIGDAIVTAANRLRKSKAKSKVIILLTDGRNNAGRVDPVTAANAAAALGIKIYAIGVGTLGKAPYPVQDAFGRTHYAMMDVKIDEETLKQVAQVTGGEYFRATNNKKLNKIYQQIDQMEKTKIEVKRYKHYKDLFQLPMFLGFLLMAAAVGIEYIVVRPLP